MLQNTQVYWAESLPTKPAFIPKSRPRGTKALGLSFEKKVAKALPLAIHGQWFQFKGQSGALRYCQTDFLWLLSRTSLIIEVKLTNISEARAKLASLYIPVVEKTYKKPALGVIIVKSVSKVPIGEKIFSSITEAIDSDVSLPVVHWLGHTSLI